MFDLLLINFTCFYLTLFKISSDAFRRGLLIWLRMVENSTCLTRKRKMLGVKEKTSMRRSCNESSFQSISCVLMTLSTIKVLVKNLQILQIRDGRSQTIGGLSFQRLNRNALAFPCLRPPPVQQLDPLHGGHLLLNLSNPYSHCPATRRGFVEDEPWSRACLLLNNWHRRLCFRPPHCPCPCTNCTGSSSNPLERDINHNSCCDHNT